MADAIEAENDLDDSKEALREIIGDSPVDLAGLGTDLPLLKPDPEDIEAWTRLAKAHNLNIIARQNQAEFAKKNIERQRSGHYPTLDIRGSYAYQDDNSSFGLRGDTGRIGLELNVPLFTGGSINSRTRQAFSEFHATQQQLTAARRSVIRQVKSGYRGIISPIGQVKARAATVRSSKSALEATKAGFEVGTRTSVYVVAEQRNLFRSKRDHAQSRYDYIRNWLRLKAAVSDLNRNDLEKFNRLLSKKLERGKSDSGVQYGLAKGAPTDDSSAPIISDPPTAQVSLKRRKKIFVVQDSNTAGTPGITKSSSQSESGRENWVLAQNPGHYTVQLAAFRRESEVKSFISKSGIGDDLGYFKFDREGRIWYAVIDGAFEQYDQASRAIRTLPKNTKRPSPWIMKFSRIQRQLIQR